jgi:hypothetical protein
MYSQPSVLVVLRYCVVLLYLAVSFTVRLALFLSLSFVLERGGGIWYLRSVQVKWPNRLKRIWGSLTYLFTFTIMGISTNQNAGIRFWVGPFPPNPCAFRPKSALVIKPSGGCPRLGGNTGFMEDLKGRWEGLCHKFRRFIWSGKVNFRVESGWLFWRMREVVAISWSINFCQNLLSSPKSR